MLTGEEKKIAPVQHPAKVPSAKRQEKINEWEESGKKDSDVPSAEECADKRCWSLFFSAPEKFQTNGTRWLPLSQSRRSHPAL